LIILVLTGVFNTKLLKFNKKLFNKKVTTDHLQYMFTWETGRELEL